MPLSSSTTSRNKPVTLRRPTITHLLMRPVNLAVLAAGLAVGVILATLTTQPPLVASAQTSLCGNDICEGPVEQPYNCSDCLPTCDGANWCTDGIGASPAGCPDYTEYDDWAYVPGVDYCSSAGCCVSVEGDDNPPVTTAILDGTHGLDEWFVSPVTVSLSVSDDWSGVFSTNLDGEPYTGPQLYDTEGATTISYQSYDNAGNLEPLKTTTFYIDTVPPATTVVVPTNNSWVSGVFTIAGISTDATSGLAGVDVSFDQGLTWLPATGGEVWAYPWDTRTLGVNIIQVRGRDQAGNNETPIVLAVSIDNSGPFFEVGPFPGEHCFTCSGPLTFTMTAFDEQSHINNSAIVVKQNGKDIRVLQAPGGELRNTPVVWDGRDSQGQLVPPGDYQLLFYTANYAGMFGSFGSGIRVVDVLPAVPPAPAPVLPADPPEDAPWIVSSNPPTPTPFIPASGITSGPVSVAPQVAAVPQTGGGSTSSLTGASGGTTGGKTSAAATGAAALLVAAAAYIATQQATGNLSLGKKLAELAGQWKPSAKPVAPPVGRVAPPQAPPPPPPRPRRLRWNEIPRVMPPPPPAPPKPVYYPPRAVSSITKRWPGHGGVLGGAYGASRSVSKTPYRGGVLGGAYGGYSRSTQSGTRSPIPAIWSAVERTAPVIASTVGRVASWGSWLAGPMAAADAGKRIGQVLVPAHSTVSRTWSDMYRFTGTLRDRAWLNMVPKTNQVGVNNVSAISNAGLGLRGALVGTTSVPTAIGVLGTLIVNTNDYNQGKVDRFRYSASLLVDSLSTVAAAALAGAVAGAVTAGVAGAVGGAVVLPIVGAVPGAVIGGVVGAICGAAIGIGASLGFNNLRVIPTASGENISARDACVNGLADGLKAGVGWLDSVVTP